MIKFPKSFDSYNSRYYGNLNAPTIPSKKTLDELTMIRDKLENIKHLNAMYSNEIDRAMRDITGYSDNMVKRLIKKSKDLYSEVLKSILFNPI
jgi:hypothetical protein